MLRPIRRIVACASCVVAACTASFLLPKLGHTGSMNIEKLASRLPQKGQQRVNVLLYDLPAGHAVVSSLRRLGNGSFDWLGASIAGAEPAHQAHRMRVDGGFPAAKKGPGVALMLAHMRWPKQKLSGPEADQLVSREISSMFRAASSCECVVLHIVAAKSCVSAVEEYNFAVPTSGLQLKERTLAQTSNLETDQIGYVVLPLGFCKEWLCVCDMLQTGLAILQWAKVVQAKLGRGHIRSPIAKGAARVPGREAYVPRLCADQI